MLEYNFFQTAGFWVGFTFIFLLLLLYKLGIFSAIIKFLDTKAQNIFDVVEEAKQLKIDAESALALHQKKQFEISNEIEKIIMQAKSVASDIKKTTDEKISKYVDNKNIQRQNHLRLIESNFLNNIKANVADSVYKNIINNYKKYDIKNQNVELQKILENTNVIVLKK